MESYPANNTQELLQRIQESIETEIRFKQDLIVRQQREIDRLRKQEEDHKTLISEQKLKLQNDAAQNEGNKQLINKLLGDISRLQNDIEWYNRTFVKRSFLGVLRQRLFGTSSK